MKRITYLLLVLLLSLFLVSCSDSNDPGLDPDTNITYTVTFDTNGGNNVNDLSIVSNITVNFDLYTTQKDGFTFLGWSLTKDGDLIISPQVITKNITVFAIYELEGNTFKITFNDEDGNLLTVKNVIEGQLPSYNYVPEDTAEFKVTFKGWSINPDGEQLTSIPSATANATYYALVTKTKQQYTINFVTNGGSEINNLTSDYGSEINDLPKSIKEGYNFVGWTSDTELNNKVQLPFSLTQNVTLYGSWNEKVNYGEYLTALFGGYKVNPYSFIPSTMQPENKVVAESSIIADYSSFVNVNAINYQGYGEQWQMVLDNLNESQRFFNVLTVVETISSGSVIAFNNYLDSNPANANEFEHQQGIYKVNIEFKDNLLYYIVSYDANIPFFGQQTIQIALTHDITTLEKTGRIQIGDANALKYESSDNKYTFGIMYLGVRRAYFEVSRDSNGKVEGSIFEHLTVAGVGLSSAAQFYITNEYVSVVGNKADGMLLTVNTINELYSVNTGTLLGYEIREQRSLIKFDTLWFNLKDQTGINNIRVIKNEDDKELVYINNNSNTEFKTKNISIVNISRRYDIEFRTQYLYIENENNELVQVKVKVPMLFVQESQYTNLTTDIKTQNPSQITNFAMTISQIDLGKIKSDYATLIDIFIANKERMTPEEIMLYIGTKIIIS